VDRLTRPEARLTGYRGRPVGERRLAVQRRPVQRSSRRGPQITKSTAACGRIAASRGGWPSRRGHALSPGAGDAEEQRLPKATPTPAERFPKQRDPKPTGPPSPDVGRGDDGRARPGDEGGKRLAKSRHKPPAAGLTAAEWAGGVGGPPAGGSRHRLSRRSRSATSNHLTPAARFSRIRGPWSTWPPKNEAGNHGGKAAVCYRAGGVAGRITAPDRSITRSPRKQDATACTSPHRRPWSESSPTGPRALDPGYAPLGPRRRCGPSYAGTSQPPTSILMATQSAGPEPSTSNSPARRPVAMTRSRHASPGSSATTGGTASALSPLRT